MIKHRGLSAVVGSIFLVAVVISALSYVTYSMNILGNFSESLIAEEKRQNEKQSEIFELSSIETTPAQKLDGVVTNIGQIPLEIKSIWIEEVGTPNSMKKFDIGVIIAPGNQFDLIDSVDFDMNATKGYTLKLVSGRGEIQTFHVNSVGANSLYLNSYTIPETIPTGFDTTILLTVTNNSTSNAPILNLMPTQIVVDESACTPNCSATYVSGPIPEYYPSLKQGETAIFSWVYTVSGSDANQIIFNTSLENGIITNTASSTIKIREVQSAISSGTALTSLGLDDILGSDDVLYLHQDTFDTPSTSYQMAGTTPDSNGQYIDLSTEIPNFFTSNSSSVIDIPSGQWTGALKILHEYLPDSLIESGSNEVDVIFHLNDNASPETDSAGNTPGLTKCTGSNSPSYTTIGGVDNSPHYIFDGNDCMYSFEFRNPTDYRAYVDIESDDDSTSLWFKADQYSTDARRILIRFDPANSGYNVDFYQISIGDGTSGNRGKTVFEFDTNGGNTRVKCVSDIRNDDGNWHHVVAVRDADRKCDLYVDGVHNDSDTVGGSGNDIDTADNSRIRIGYNGAGEYFTGSLDQIMHWNDKGLSSTEVTDLYNTQYGDTASVMDFIIYQTDNNGNNIEPPIINLLNQPIPFKDTKDVSTTSDYNSIDSIFKNHNFTSSANAVTITENNRLNFTINYKSGLDTIMRIDDNTMSNPKSSFLQIPLPNPPFSAYFKYDNDDILRVIAYNTGDIGSWFTYQGTRAIFQNLDTGDSYAGIVCSVNSTLTGDECNTGGANDSWKMDEDRDSIFIDAGEIAYMYFWQIQNRPDRNTSQGTVIPAGDYHMYVFISGYDELGRSFLRQIDVGKIEVSN